MLAPARPTAVAWVLAFGSLACARETVEQPERLVAQACAAGLSADARCYALSVPEDHGRPRGRRITLAVAVVPARSAPAQPDPILVLSGGPGDAASFGYSRTWQAYAAYNATRDLVFVDQRGTGRSSKLACGFEGSDDELQEYVDVFQAPDALQRCTRALGDSVDLSRYRTADFVADLEVLRQALRIGHWNLHAGSYGTRVAQQYMARHPASIRSSVLIGVVARELAMPMPFAEDVGRALDMLAAECRADVRCNSAFPAFRREVDSVAARLDRGAIVTTVMHPATGAPVQVRFTRHAYGEALRTTLYSPELTRQLPLAVREAFLGSPAALAAIHLRRQRNIAQEGWQGLYLAVTCAEDVARVDTVALYAGARGTAYGDSRSRQHVAACRGWPVDTAGLWPASDRITTPVLMIAGDMDPATPPRWAVEAQRAMTTSRLIVVPFGGHGFGGLSDPGCIRDLQIAFYEKPEPAAVDASCVTPIRRLPFVLAR